MTNEQAKSEIMQIYGSLSEEKKRALDVLMAQADKSQANLQAYVYQSALDNKRNTVIATGGTQSQADGEYKTKKNCDTCDKAYCGDVLCFGNDYCDWQPKQADGEYISKTQAIDDITTGLCEDIACEKCPFDKPDIICKVRKWLKQLPSVAIPNKTGHWECDELFYEGESRGAIIKCSECGNELKVSPKVFENLYDNERFCNHCGAKMD